MTTRAPLFIILAVGLSSCQGSTAPSLTIDDLLAVPTSVVIDQNAVSASAGIWRDQMPGVVGPTPLGADIRITGPGSLEIVRVWIILGDDVWTGPAERAYEVGRWSAKGGPEWPIGAETTVVIQVRGRRDVGRVRIAGVRIQAAV